MKREPSKYQKEILDWVENGSGFPVRIIMIFKWGYASESLEISGNQISGSSWEESSAIMMCKSELFSCKTCPHSSKERIVKIILEYREVRLWYNCKNLEDSVLLHNQYPLYFNGITPQNSKNVINKNYTGR